jgi:hypothetical protein
MFLIYFNQNNISLQTKGRNVTWESISIKPDIKESCKNVNTILVIFGPKKRIFFFKNMLSTNTQCDLLLSFEMNWQTHF